MGKMIKLLTFNIWDMPIWLPKLEKRKRLGRIPEEINKLAPNIICLQESFKIKNRRKIIESLNSKYYSTSSNQTQSICLLIRKDIHGGVLILSHYPIIDVKFIKHPVIGKMSFDEKYSQKGSLFAILDIFKYRILLVSTHLYAGRKEEDTQIRLKQLDNLQDNIEKLSIETDAIVLTGDFNSSPTTPFPAKRNFKFNPEYEKVLSMGFTEVLPKFDKSTITYAIPGNKYAEMWYNVSKTSQRFAYIYFKSLGIKFKVLNTKVVFNYSEPLSDHYGLYSELLF